MSRNAIKYQPFNALEGHKEALQEKEKSLSNVEKPVLSEDDYERINYILIQIIEENIEGTFFIFKKNRIIEITSKVKKISNGYLYLEEEVISINDVINIIK